MEHSLVMKRKVEGNEKINEIRAKIYYDKGGYNGWTGNTDRRGYWISVVPVKVEGCFVKFDAWSGTKLFIEEVKAYNAKKFLALANAPETISKIDELVNYVKAKNGIV